MHSLVKIYGNDLLVDQTETFSFSTKAYKKLWGIWVCGEAEISLVFYKDNNLVINSMDISNFKSNNPNKRVFPLNQDIKNEIIKGSITKINAPGLVSIYLLID